MKEDFKGIIKLQPIVTMPGILVEKIASQLVGRVVKECSKINKNSITTVSY